MYALALIRYRRPIEEVVVHQEAHRAFQRKLLEEGKLLAAGPHDPRFGGMMLLRVQDNNAQKLAGLRRILDGLHVGMHEVAHIGDDFPDLAIMQRVALPVAVGNAVPEVKAIARVQLARSGGRGAVREFVEMLLRARGVWDEVVGRYVAERSGEPREVVRS